MSVCVSVCVCVSVYVCVCECVCQWKPLYPGTAALGRAAGPAPQGSVPCGRPLGTTGGSALVQWVGRWGNRPGGRGGVLSKVPSSSGNRVQDLGSPAHGGGAGSPGLAARGHQVGPDLLQRGRCPLLTAQQRLVSESLSGPDRVHPFSFCHQSFPASGTFPIGRPFTSEDQNTEPQLQHQSF